MSSVLSHRSGEHLYFLVAAVVVTAGVFWGFGFEFDDLVHPGQFTGLVLAHGAAMLAWVVLFPVQVLLAMRGKLAAHRRLGALGAVIAALVVVLGVPTVITAARLGQDHIPPGTTPVGFLADGLSQLLAFTLLAGAGLAFRRRRDVHKRLMLLATLPPLLAALVRINAYMHWHLGGLAMRNGLLVAFLVVDALRYRRLHPAFVAGSVLLLGIDRIVDAGVETESWRRIATNLLG